MPGPLDPARVLRALAHPELGPELHHLGVRDLTGFGDPEVGIPPEQESYVEDLIEEKLAEPDAKPQKPKPGRGRRDKDVSVLEANRAARVYVANGGATDYGVHELYKEELAADGIAYDAKTGPHLSRPMVAHLMAAIDGEWLPWDPVRKSLRISDEFRTRRGRFVIPRRNPARRAKI
jgi:hypothetical protein